MAESKAGNGDTMDNHMNRYENGGRPQNGGRGNVPGGGNGNNGNNGYNRNNGGNGGNGGGEPPRRPGMMMMLLGVLCAIDRKSVV